VTNELRVRWRADERQKFAAVAPIFRTRAGRKNGEALLKSCVTTCRAMKGCELAKMNSDFSSITEVNEVERYLGTGSTDFWGISFAFSSFDKQDMSSDQLCVS